MRTPFYRFDKKTSVTIILIFTIITVIDSTIVKVVTFSGNELPVATSVSIFISFVAIFAFGGISLLTLLKKNVSTQINKKTSNTDHFLHLAYATLFLTTAIALTAIIQMVFLNLYDLHFLIISSLVTHVTAILYLIFLIRIFIQWIRSRKNYIILLFMISITFLCISMIVSVIYLEYIYSRSYSMERKPFPIHTFIIRQEVTSFSESLGTLFDFLYLSAFATIWIATAILLYQYRYKLGKIRYFLLISLPLVYYSFTYLAYFGNLFSILILDSPVGYGISYVLFFSATKQVGAFFFGITFLTASTIVKKDDVGKSLLITGIGIAILFGSLEITTLQYRLYPPYGYITQSLLPLGAYLLFIGIFGSATKISRDAELRQEFHKTAMSQLSLLKTIGTRQMEVELMKKFRTVEKRTHSMDSNQQTLPEEEEVRQIVREVLDEIRLHKINDKPRESSS